MPRYIPLNASQHPQAGWLPYTDYLFAADQALVAVSLEEVPHVLKAVPLAFREVKGGHYQLVAIQSLTKNVNLCVAANGRWLTGYIPALYRAHPFKLLPAENSRQWVLCVDVDSGLWLDDATEQGKRCFEYSGKDTAIFAKLKLFLNKVVRGQVMAAQATNMLVQEQVVQPWPLQTQDAGGGTQQVQGLYRIDEEKLNSLPAASLERLRNGGGLSLAYAQLFSQHRLSNLAELYRLHHTDTHNPEDLNEFFEDNDNITFNFDD